MNKALYQDFFKNKKVTVLGLGILGRGVGDTRFLAENDVELIVTDKKNEEQLATSIGALSSYPSIVYHLGEHQYIDFENRDFVIKTAGAPTDSEYVLHAQERDIPIYMSAALLVKIIYEKLEGVTIIGVTGTRGKSTTTQMIAHVLKNSGLKVHLGGNIRGVANLPLLEIVEEGDFLVLELDSWQLQGFGDLKISPNIAVFTSFMDDHMNYYKNNKKAYFDDKANIYRNQKEYDVLITSKQAREAIKEFESNVESLTPEIKNIPLKLIGEHNQVAASLAYEVGVQCGLSNEEILEALGTFEAVEGRLQDLGSFGEKHIRVFNDNNGTTGDATIAAIKAINETYGKKPILIVGGADKGLPLDALEEEIKKGVKSSVLLEGTGTVRLKVSSAVTYPTLSECVAQAFIVAEEGDIILFSPAFASFSKEFNNEYERNDAFLRALSNMA